MVQDDSYRDIYSNKITEIFNSKKKSYSDKKYLQQLHNISKRNYYCDTNNNNCYAPNYHSNYYSSNNVNITGNNIGNKVCYLF